MGGWHSATVTRLDALNDELFTVSLSVPPDVARAFDTPGQYHRLSLDGVTASPFAIASAPLANPFEYLVKRGGAVASALGQLPVGAAVKVSAPEGKGFPLAAAGGRPLLLLASGTGLAPIRATLKAVAARRGAYGPVVALLGLRSLAHLPWADEFAALAALDIDVRLTLTQPAPGWSGRTGRVQAHLGDLPVADALAFVAGHPQLVTDARAALALRGLAADRVAVNF